jgi:L-lactate dehydrogenase complex protein LldG
VDPHERALVVTAREEILSRIRGALGDSPSAPEVPRTYRQQGARAPGDPELVRQLIGRLEDYRATVVRVAEGDDDAIGQAIADALTVRDIGRVVAPPGVPPEWTSRLADVVVDEASISARLLDGIPAVVTGSVVAVAETGSIILDGAGVCGRRAITLVPDTHVCVVRAMHVVQTVPDGLRRVDPQRALTIVSGPSATSDIELDRVEGVHGPRTLVVVIAG